MFSLKNNGLLSLDRTKLWPNAAIHTVVLERLPCAAQQMTRNREHSALQLGIVLKPALELPGKVDAAQLQAGILHNDSRTIHDFFCATG